MDFKKTTNYILINGVMFLTYACNLEYFDNAELEEFTLNPSLAIPLGEISYTVSDLFEELSDPNATIAPDNEDLVTIYFAQDLASQSAASFVALGNQEAEGQLNSGIDLPNSTVSTTINVNQLFDFDLGLNVIERLDSISYSGGLIQVSIDSRISADVAFNLTILSLRDKSTNEPFKVSGVLTAANPTFTTGMDELLENYKGIFTDDGSGGVTANTLLVNLDEL